MVKFYVNIEQLRKIYRYLLNHDKIKNSVTGSSFWLNGFSMTVKDNDGNTKIFDFVQQPAWKGEYYFIKGDYPEIEKIILDYIHEKGSIGEEDWSVAFE